MTNLFTDAFTGSNGAAWNATNWTTTSVSGLNTSGASATIQGNKGRLNAGTVASYGGKSAIRYAGANIADSEFIGKFTLTTSTDGAFEVWLRAGTSAVDGTGYIFSFELGTSANVKITKGVSYTYTTLSSNSVTISQNTEYGFRCYVVGTTVKVKCWPTSGSEPTSYTATVTDSAVSASGYSYFDARGGSAAGFIVDVDDVTLTNGTSNQFTYAGSIQPGAGVFARNQVNKNPFTGSSTAVGTWSYIKVVTRIFTASITSVGALVKLPKKLFTGSSASTGIQIKTIPKTWTASATPSGVFRKAFVRKFLGTIATVGSVTTTFAGRVFGRPGIVKVTVEKAGDVRLRIRRG
jgi:hypothetical protein